MTFDLANALTVLERTPVVLQALLAGLPEVWSHADEGPDTWSPFNVVGHLIDGEETDWMVRAGIILAQGADRRFAPYDRFRHLGATRGASLSTLLDRFAELRAHNLRMLREMELGPDELSLTGEHPELGTVTLEQLLATWVAHDLGHLVQVARVMARQYGDAVGPWRKYLSVLQSAPDTTDVVGAVGRTPLVPLRHIVPKGSARVLVKVESQNPTGSMKDRMALSVVDRAVASGRLSPTGTLVEYTGGSTGTSLAFACAARGIAVTLVTSDAFSREKRDHMRALGATVVEIESEDGRTTKELIQRMMARAAELSAVPGAFFADQFNNPDAAAGYAPLADEVWAQARGSIQAFVQSVGTAQCITGVARTLRAHDPGIDIIAVEPAESAVLSGGAPGAHKIEGVGPGFVPPMWDPDLVDEIVQVSTEEAKAMTRRLAREEALFGGTSTGANVVAALRVAERIGAGGTVVTLLCDTGLKYLSTDLYVE